MRFLDPSFLPWAGLLLAAVALYLFRRRPKTVRVSTLPFFKSLAREHQESAWLRRLKQLLSFLLSALVILFCVGALARLVISPPAQSLSTVVILVDRSASMAALDARGRTRLEVALAGVRQRLAGLPRSVGCTVMAYDQRPEILLPRSFDRRQVERALDTIQVRPMHGQADAALQLAVRLAALETPAVVWHATDAPDTTELATAQVTVQPIDVALAAPTNVGITAFQMRRQPLSLSQWEAFVQLHCASPKPLEAQLEVRLDGKLTEIRRLALKPSGRQRLLIPIDGKEWKTLRLKVTAPLDVLPLDDVLEARIPEFQPIEVAWYSETPDPFTQLALTSLGEESGIAVSLGAPAAWPPKGKVDVLILDGWLPKQWPAQAAVIVINPPGSLGPLQAVRLQGTGLPLDAVRPAQPGHPVLYGVATSRISLTQTAVLETGALQPLWVGASGPVLAAGEVGGQRIVVLAFAPSQSEHLPLLASYPLLMGNAIFWSAQPQTEAQAGSNLRTGELVTFKGRTLTWTTTSENRRRQETVPLTGPLVELDRIGLWQSDSGESGSAALLAQAETLVRAGKRSGGRAAADAAVAGGSPFRGDLSAPLLWIVLAILIFENLLFHRWAIY